MSKSKYVKWKRNNLRKVMAEKNRIRKILRRFNILKTKNSKFNKIIEENKKGSKISVQKEIKFKRNELAKTLQGVWSLFSYILPIVTLVLRNASHVAGEGNVGCLYVGSLCLSGMEFCYDDLMFGKCLSKSGVDVDDIDRTPVSEEQSRILATMLEELQGADLGWDHPFVQCQIQGTLFAMRRRTQLPPNLCANLAPDPEIIGPQSPLAFVRFTSPENDEIDYQPYNKDVGFANSYGLLPQVQTRKVDNMELLTELAHRSDIVPQERKRTTQYNQAKSDSKKYIRHMNNGLNLRKILLHYENGDLFPFISTKKYVYPHTNASYDVKIYDSPIHPRNSNKRTNSGTHFLYFRELSDNNQIPLSRKNHFIPSSQEYFNYLKKSKTFDLDPHNEQINFPVKLFKLNPDEQKHFEQYGIDQMGVYTEGGFLIPSDQDNKEDRKKDARTLFANMMGFTRHERLDVKKPGPLITSPTDIKATDVFNTITQKKINTKEDMALSTIKREQINKATNIMQDHSAEDHAQYSVDTEYAFVIMKHPIDSWADGVRIVNALANTLQMNFTHPRVDSHEVSFRVEPNPEKKSAIDVAKSINTDRFKSNIYRRFGITIVRSGVGNKVKYDPEKEVVQVSKIEQTEQGPDVTHIMAYMFAGAGAAAALVIIVVLFLIRRHDKTRYKLGGLQCSTTGNESCSKDYQ
ncbi:uncharacterized protein LOC129616309, partial [Condylostylus longicornis]|uniref:uncharacterized protein LOC129616309 n=1 Tax=Condylostylus longicornis TaxID=2530218 RepID=UPI00244E451E